LAEQSARPASAEAAAKSEWVPPDTEAYEGLGRFYLGRPHDPAARSPLPGPLLYDSKDLVTHAMCVGMTGSGKTGLCIDLLEEAALDGIPAIAIDPKGDLANLLLTFPDLRTEDFREWINEEEAAAQGLSPDAFAEQQARVWRDGLAAWGQDGERIRRLRQAADFAVYTPGSSAGIGLSILRSFGAPAPAVREHEELLRDRVNGAVTALLTLIDVDADPIQSREHILLSTLLTNEWTKGNGLELASLIGQVERPGLEKLGAMELDRFFPPRARAKLAMKLNGLVAAPGFAAWLEGEPLDPAALLRAPDGRPRVSIVSIAHLSDSERMFFVTLLLGEVLAWVRAQPGTSSLRAILYMDEIFGYFPPVAEPPSKRPLLTLLKTARAHGLGVVLATQNPVDLDYRGLANTGTWLIGRLQTERDKSKLLDGLEGTALSASSSFDRRSIEETIGRLGKRVFLLSDVHEAVPAVFESRWAMSYLRGPLTRPQIARLMEGRRGTPQGAPRSFQTTAAVPSGVASHTAAPPSPDETQRARERRDEAVESITAKYGKKKQRLEQRIIKAERVVQREEAQAKGAQVQTAVSVGATILSAFLGRKRLGYTTLGRGTTAARGAARAMEQREDVARAKVVLEAARAELAALEERFKAELSAAREAVAAT
jgi:hypothetical protein